MAIGYVIFTIGMLLLMITIGALINDKTEYQDEGDELSVYNGFIKYCVVSIIMIIVGAFLAWDYQFIIELIGGK